MSLRRRLALLSTGAVMLVVLGSAVALYFVVRQQLHDDLVDQLRAQAAVHASRDFAVLRHVGTLDGAGTPAPPVLPRLISADNEILAARFPALAYPITPAATDVAAGRRSSSLEPVHLGDDRFQVLTVQAGDGRAFQLAQSLASVDATLGRLRVALVAVTIAAVIASPVAGMLVAGGGLRPVRRLTRAADQIARTGDLAYRIEVRGQDELGSLAASYNAMLDRLAAMMRRSSAHGSLSASSPRTSPTSCALRSPRCARTSSCSRSARRTTPSERNSPPTSCNSSTRSRPSSAS